MWAFLGMGTVRTLVEKGDPSPYINLDNIDPEWMKAMNMNADKVKEVKIEQMKKEAIGEGKKADTVISIVEKSQEEPSVV